MIRSAILKDISSITLLNEHNNVIIACAGDFIKEDIPYSFYQEDN